MKFAERAAVAKRGTGVIAPQLSRVLCPLLVGAAMLVATATAAAPRVIFTVDVESGGGYWLPEQVDAVCQGGSACGLMELARMLSERKLSATFYLNVYEHRRWGEGRMREIVEKLQSAGQDVALHTHPQWAYDPNRNGMNQYSLEEQTAIIRDGVGLLSKWSGLPVVAHRTGDYAADERTLTALEVNGVRVDSSLFWGHPHCRLNDLGLARNLPSIRGKLLEIPVTIYERSERPGLLSRIAPPLPSIRKIDADWLMSAEETKMAMDAVVEANLPYLVVFLHSFTLISGTSSDGVPVLNRRAQAVLSVILDRVAEKRLPVVTMRDVAVEKATVAAKPGPDLVPVVSVEVDLPRYLWHALRARERSVLIVTAVASVTLLAVVVLVVVRRRKSRSV